MKTLVWLMAIIALSAFIFSATVNAANTLVQQLELTQWNNSVQELMIK